uniref:Uncharacterized protein n=1 Tax=Plectus sambesii TaxID=2011161 RepID=A0A914W5W8_9BILA
MSAAEHDNRIGLFGATSYVVGNIIGSGIFVSPSGILRRTNSVGLSLIIWVVSGLITVLGAFCYIELGTAIRESGADFAYICYVKWYPIAFAFMWVNVILTYPASAAVGIETFGEYVLTALEPIVCIEATNRAIAKKLFAFAMILLLTMTNLLSLKRYASRLQILFTAAKVLAMIIIIVTGFYYLAFRGGSSNFSNLMDHSKYSPGDLTLAVYGGLWAYGGYNVLNFGIEEIKNPRRTVPLAFLIGLALVTLLYLTINVAYFAVLSQDEMLDSETIAVAQQFATKALGNFAYAYPAIIGIVLCGTTNSAIFSSSRYMFAAARRGHLPSSVAILNIDTDSPRVAVVAFSLLTMAMSFIGDIEQLINYVISLSWFQTCFTLAALIWIRFKHIPVHEKALTFNLAIPFLYLLVSIMLVAVPIYQRPVETAIGVGLLLSGFMVYYALLKTRMTPQFLRNLNESSTEACQKFFLGVPQLSTGSSAEVRQRKNTVVDNTSNVSIKEQKF